MMVGLPSQGAEGRDDFVKNVKDNALVQEEGTLALDNGDN
jgi:hypothetical protein